MNLVSHLLVMASHDHAPDNYPQAAPHNGLYPVEPRQQNDKEVWAQYASPQYVQEDKTGPKIGGLKPWLFWAVIALISVVVVAASVGGAVGGTRAVKSKDSEGSPTISTTQASASSISSTSVSSASRYVDGWPYSLALANTDGTKDPPPLLHPRPFRSPNA